MAAYHHPKDWPGRVVPQSEVEITTAVAALCLRAQWTTVDQVVLQRELVPLFLRKWCVDAIFVALDYAPDGRAYRSPKRPNQSAYHFLRTRLQPWRSGSNDFADPPLQGLTLAEWLDVNQRNSSNYQPRTIMPLSQQGRIARELTRNIANARKRDPVARSRERARRWQEMLDGLLAPQRTISSS